MRLKDKFNIYSRPATWQTDHFYECIIIRPSFIAVFITYYISYIFYYKQYNDIHNEISRKSNSGERSIPHRSHAE